MVFRWAVLKAATVIATHTSGLFYQLYYREIFRQLYDLTKDPKQTVTEAARLGWLAAEESAERQKAIFKLFPEDPKKVVEYLPLLWQVTFGMPMENYTQEWDLKDPAHPILRFKCPANPLLYELGKDKAMDNLPFKNFTDEHHGYSAIICGMMSEASTFILETKNVKKAILITEGQNLIKGDKFFELTCHIINIDELPAYTKNLPLYNKINDPDQSPPVKTAPNTNTATSSTNSTPTKETATHDVSEEPTKVSFIDKLTKNFTIDRMEEYLSKPTGLLEVTIKNVMKEKLHMESQEFIDHFTNFEQDFVRIIGLLSVHVLNEMGQIPQKMFENEQIAKVVGHSFLLAQKNAPKFIPEQVLDDLRKLFESIMESIAPPEFVSNFRAIPSAQLMTLYFEGIQKGLKDLKIPFATLKTNLYEEFKKVSDSNQKQTSEAGSDTEQKAMRDQIIFEIGQEAVIMAFGIMSIPAQLGVLLLVNTGTGIAEITSSIFKILNEGSQRITALLEKMNNK